METETRVPALGQLTYKNLRTIKKQLPQLIWFTQAKFISVGQGARGDHYWANPFFTDSTN